MQLQEMLETASMLHIFRCYIYHFIISQFYSMNDLGKEEVNNDDYTVR